MTDTRLTWSPGPPPPAEGLRSAFRAADRRRARTAMAAAVPVVVAAALAMTTSMQTGGTDSLQLPPSQHVPVTGSDRQAPDGPADQAPLAVQPAPRPAPTASGKAAAGGAEGAGARPAAVAPAPAPKPAPAGSIDLAAEHSARVQVRLAKAVHPQLARTEFERSGRYAGVWIVDAHGAVVGSALEVAGASGRLDRRYTDTPEVVPAGSYTFYVVGEGPTGVHIALLSGEKGIKASATRAVAASYTTTSHTMSAVETTASLRLHLPTTASVGYTGGFVDTPGGAASTVSVCLPHRDAQCASGDPQRSESSQLNVGGGYGVTFDVDPKLLRVRRDVLVDAEMHGTGSTELVCWSVTVALS